MLRVTPDLQQCPAFGGLYFPADETVIPLSGDASQGFETAERQPILAVVPADLLTWSPSLEVYTGCVFEGPEVRVVGGGGAYEGEGFLAAFSMPSQECLWLLYSEACEVFRTVTMSGSVVVAQSGDPPCWCEWRIPLHDPDAFEVHHLRGDPSEALKRVVDEATFLNFVEALAANRRADASGQPDRFGRGPDGWENHTIEAFLGAASRWARDTGMGESQGLDEASPWKRFAVFLYSGKIYE